MAIGTVKWFNPTKGYGFIQPDNGGEDVFPHLPAVEKAGFSGLVEGTKASYKIIWDRGKERADNLRIGGWGVGQQMDRADKGAPEGPRVTRTANDGRRYGRLPKDT